MDKKTFYENKVFNNSVDNIIIYENLLEQQDLEKLMDFVKTADFDYQGTKEKTEEELEIEKNIYKQYQKELPEEIKTILSKIFDKTRTDFEQKYQIKIENRIEDGGNSYIFLNKWKKNIHMNLHYDEFLMPDFNVSTIYYLNDNYGGGEIHFPVHNLKIKPKANSAITFPGSESYAHEILEVFDNDRYTSSAWFKFSNLNFTEE